MLSMTALPLSDDEAPIKCRFHETSSECTSASMSIHTQLELSVGFVLGYSVGSTVGIELGCSVGSIVGTPLGLSVGLTVGWSLGLD